MKFVCTNIEEDGILREFTLSNEFVPEYKITVDQLRSLMEAKIVEVENLKLTANRSVVIDKDFGKTAIDNKIASLNNGFGINSNVIAIDAKKLHSSIKRMISLIPGKLKILRYEQVKDLDAYANRLKSLGKEYIAISNTDGHGGIAAIVTISGGNTLTIVYGTQIKLSASKVTEYAAYGVFNDLNELTVDVRGLHLERMSSLQFAFHGLECNTLVIENMDLSNIRDTENMFTGSLIKNLTLRNLKLTNLISCRSMFSGCKIENLLIESMELPMLMTIEKMFESADIRNLKFKNIRANNITNMKFAFNSVNNRLKSKLNLVAINDESLLLNLTIENCSFNTENVLYADGMFAWANIDKVDLSSFTNRSNKLLSTFEMFKDARINDLIINNLNIDSIADVRQMFDSISIRNISIHPAIGRVSNNKKAVTYTKRKVVRNTDKNRIVTVPASAIDKINDRFCENEFENWKVTVRNRVVPMDMIKYYGADQADKFKVSRWSIRFKRVSSIKDLKHKGIKLENIAGNVYMHVDNSKMLITVLCEYRMMLGDRQGYKGRSAFAGTHFYSIDVSGLEVKYRDDGYGDRSVCFGDKIMTHQFICNNVEIEDCTIGDMFSNCYIDKVNFRGCKFNNVNGPNHLSSFICEFVINNGDVKDCLKQFCIPEPKKGTLVHYDYLYGSGYKDRAIGISNLI